MGIFDWGIGEIRVFGWQREKAKDVRGFFGD